VYAKQSIESTSEDVTLSAIRFVVIVFRLIIGNVQKAQRSDGLGVFGGKRTQTGSVEWIPYLERGAASGY